MKTLILISILTLSGCVQPKKDCADCQVHRQRIWELLAENRALVARDIHGQTTNYFALKPYDYVHPGGKIYQVKVVNEFDVIRPPTNSNLFTDGQRSNMHLRLTAWNGDGSKYLMPSVMIGPGTYVDRHVSFVDRKNEKGEWVRVCCEEAE